MPTLDVCLTPRKNNLGPLGAPVAYRLDFLPERITVARIDAASVEEFAATLPP